MRKRERSKTFLLPRHKFCVFKIYCLGTQTRKHSGNIRSQCFFSVSQVIPRLLPHATHVEDTKSVSLKQKMLLKFSKNIFCVLDAFLLPQQCFLVCASLKSSQIRTNSQNQSFTVSQIFFLLKIYNLKGWFNANMM